MSRGKPLSLNEKHTIKKLRGKKMTLTEIARVMNRSISLVSTYLKNPKGYGVKKSPGMVPKISPQAKRQIIRLAVQDHKSSSEIKKSLNLEVSDRSIRRILAANPNVIWKKVKTVPVHNAEHIKKRLSFAFKHAKDKTIWDLVVFSDEKKFNLDGPDGFKYYWHDLRNDPKVMSKRQSGGGSIMIWAGFSVYGKTKLHFITERMNSIKYIRLLEESFVPYLATLEEENGDNILFQQDNAPIHVSKKTRKWMTSQEIRTLEWPSKSPDLNPIENLWGIMSREVYENGRKEFHSKEELKKAIIKCWDEIPNSTLKLLAHSMHDRCLHVIRNGGAKIEY